MLLYDKPWTHALSHLFTVAYFDTAQHFDMAQW